MAKKKKARKKSNVWMIAALAVTLVVIIIAIALAVHNYSEKKAAADAAKKVEQDAVDHALIMYDHAYATGNFSSQCLGTYKDYAVHIVHVPRTAEDSLPENQCQDYLTGKVKHFIELDSDGRIVRIL